MILTANFKVVKTYPLSPSSIISSENKLIYSNSIGNNSNLDFITSIHVIGTRISADISLLLNSDYALLKIAEILNETNDILLIKYWINKTKYSFEHKLFKNDFYYDFDIKRNKLIEIKTISGLSSILVCDNHKTVQTILIHNFIDIESNNYNISSLDRGESCFNPINYWRGPMWVNLSWLVINGLNKNNYIELAKKIQKSCIEKIKTIGYYEYFDSNDMENNILAGCGDNRFSWTAAIFICMLSDIKL